MTSLIIFNIYFGVLNQIVQDDFSPISFQRSKAHFPVAFAMISSETRLRIVKEIVYKVLVLYVYVEANVLFQFAERRLGPSGSEPSLATVKARVAKSRQKRQHRI